MTNRNINNKINNMEANTTCIDLEKYDELKEEIRKLKEFRDKIHSDFIDVEIRARFFDATYIFYTKDEAIKKIADSHNKLIERIEELKNPKEKEITLNDIKNMSLLQFLKWRRK